MSEFAIEIVRVGEVHKHPNADRLELTTIHAAPDGTGGYPVIFQAGLYKEGERAVYVPVDAVVPEAEEWAWLWEATPNPPPRKRRIKAKKLRGIFSMGLLHPVPALYKHYAVGADLADVMGITKYEDPEESEGDIGPRAKRGVTKPRPWYVKAWRRVLRFLGFNVPNGAGTGPQYGLEPPPLNHLPGVYGVEQFRKYGTSWFQPSEEVIVTEKIHGQNASFVVDATGKFHLKSRTRWRENDPTKADNAWAKVAARYDLEAKLATVPGVILYGETYGNFTDLPYGASKEAPGFVAFDAFDSVTGSWLPWDVFIGLCEQLEIPVVPTLYRGPVEGVTKELADGKTTLNLLYTCMEGHAGAVVRSLSHVREGFVIKPTSNRTQHGGQRIILKLHGEGFLTRKDPAPLPDGKPINTVIRAKPAVTSMRQMINRVDGRQLPPPTYA